MSESENKSSPKQIPCPQCRKPTVYSTANAFRPFCSERCRLIDLGEWASEAYRIPVSQTSHEDFSVEELEDFDE